MSLSQRIRKVLRAARRIVTVPSGPSARAGRVASPETPRAESGNLKGLYEAEEVHTHGSDCAVVTLRKGGLPLALVHADAGWRINHLDLTPHQDPCSGATVPPTTAQLIQRKIGSALYQRLMIKVQPGARTVVSLVAKPRPSIATLRNICTAIGPSVDVTIDTYYHADDVGFAGADHESFCVNGRLSAP
jgi:hypothetical protein